jgi:hypothetical protein
VCMPMRRAVLMTRQAISPRLAMRILRNMVTSRPDGGALYAPWFQSRGIGLLGRRDRRSG